jgi:preprotein translocase subunit SecF
MTAVDAGFLALLLAMGLILLVSWIRIEWRG